MYLLYTPHTQLSLPPCHTHAICANSLSKQASLAIVPFWCGGSRHVWGFSPELADILQKLSVFCCMYLITAIRARSCTISKTQHDYESGAFCILVPTYSLNGVHWINASPLPPSSNISYSNDGEVSRVGCSLSAKGAGLNPLLYCIATWAHLIIYIHTCNGILFRRKKQHRAYTQVNRDRM